MVFVGDDFIEGGVSVGDGDLAARRANAAFVDDGRRDRIISLDREPVARAERDR